MDKMEDLQYKAEYLSKALQEELAKLAAEFESKVKETGNKYGILLFTEVSVGIDSKKSGE